MSHRQSLLHDTPTTIQYLQTNDPFEIKNEQISPDLVIWTYIAVVVVAGALINIVLILTLIKAKTNGKSIVKCSFHSITNYCFFVNLSRHIHFHHTNDSD